MQLTILPNLVRIYSTAILTTIEMKTTRSTSLCNGPYTKRIHAGFLSGRIGVPKAVSVE